MVVLLKSRSLTDLAGNFQVLGTTRNNFLQSQDLINCFSNEVGKK